VSVATGLVHALAAGDRKVMLRLNHWQAPKWVRIWMIGATRLGDGWLWYAVAALVLAFGGPDRFAALLTAALTIGAGILLFRGIKKKFGRTRPCAIEAHCWSKVLPPEQFSFPSGHTITAFIAAGTLSYFYPGAAPGLYFCAFSIAISRVLLGMHFVSDVLAGAVIGASLALLSTHTIGWL
jgi:undecaprenyl-diphosphatase